MNQLLLALMVFFASVAVFPGSVEANSVVDVAWEIDERPLNTNVVYSPLFTLLWRQVQSDLEVIDVELFRPPAQLAFLNHNPTRSGWFNEQDIWIKILYGYELPDIQEEIAKTRGESLSFALDRSWDVDPVDVLGFASLSKKITLPKILPAYEKPHMFYANQVPKQIPAMALERVERPWSEEALQVKVFEYNNDKNFLIGFDLETEETLYVAMLEPLSSFKETVDYVRRRIEEGYKDPTKMEQLYKGDSLVLPMIDLDVVRRIGDLEENSVRNSKTKGWFFSKVFEEFALQFHGDGGAWVSEEQPVMTRNVHTYFAHFESGRSYVVNRPFLLMLQKKGQEEPYLILWVKDPELLHPS